MYLETRYRIQPEVREYVLTSLLKDQDETSAIHLKLAKYYRSRAELAKSKLDARSSELPEDDQATVSYLEDLALQFYHLARAREFAVAMDLIPEMEKTVSEYQGRRGEVEPEREDRSRLQATASALEQALDPLFENYLYKDGLAVGNVLADLYEKLGERWQVGRVLERQVEMLEQSSEYREALKKQKKSVAIWRKLKDDRNVGTSLINLAWLHQLLGQPKSALKAADEAMEYKLRAADEAKENVEPEPDPIEIALLLDQQGIALRELGRYEEALVKLSRSIEIKQEQRRHLAEAFTWKEKGFTLFAVGRLKEAAYCFYRALQAEDSSGRHTKLVKELRAQGLELEVIRLYSEALNKYSEALKVAQSAHSELCEQLEADVQRVKVKLQSSESSKS